MRILRAGRFPEKPSWTEGALHVNGAPRADSHFRRNMGWAWASGPAPANTIGGTGCPEDIILSQANARRSFAPHRPPEHRRAQEERKGL